MSLQSFIKIKLIQKRGNSLISGIIAGTFLVTTLGLMINAHFSTLKFKSRAEQKASLAPVLDSLLGSLAKASFYDSMAGTAPNDSLTPAQFINRLLGTDPTTGGLDVAGGGKLIPFSLASANLVSGTNASDKATFCNNSSKAPLVPSAKTSDAIFVFCASLKNSNSATPDSFFGSDAGFAVFRVTLKRLDSPQKDFLTTAATWGSFLDDPNPNGNFQAEITYWIFWGKQNDSANSFEKFGVALKDLT